MHIALILTQSLSSPSGLGRYWPLAKEMVRMGHQVTILALHHNLTPECKRRFVQDGVHVWYVSQMHVQKIGSRKSYYGPLKLFWVILLATWRLTWAALCTPADAYHVCKPHPMNGIAGVVASRLRRKPLFLDCDDYEAVSNRFGARWQKWVIAFFEDHLPTMASGVTVNTHFTLERLKNLGYPAGKIAYVPNGVDRQRFSNVDQNVGQMLREQLGLKHCSVILYVGSLSLTSHPVDLLISAFAGLLSQISDVVLVLVGGGEDYDRLRQQAQELGIGDKTCIIGHVAPDQVQLYLSLADVTVDPVLDDDTARARSPLKIVESIAMGIPVVTSNVGDRQSMLANGELGLLVQPGNSTALTEGLAYILQNPTVRAHMRQASLTHREQWYWERLARIFADVYLMNNV